MSEIYIETDDDAWKKLAACRGMDPALFYPQGGKPNKKAIDTCDACEVKNDCLEYAILNEEKFGIWGGYTETQRRSLVRQRQAAAKEAEIRELRKQMPVRLGGLAVAGD